MIGGLVLAAGAGTRFGGPKALVQVAGERWVDRAVALLRTGGADIIAVVVGAADISGTTADAIVYNPDWGSGMGSSLRAGLTSPVFAGCSAIAVLLVDQPGIAAEAVARVVAAHADGAELAVATYGGVRGHPVVLGRDHWAGVAAAATGDRGARPYLVAHAGQVRDVACDGLGDPADIDTAAELAARFPAAAQVSPGPAE